MGLRGLGEGNVEPESLDLPDMVLQLAIGVEAAW
jgi:hypothetical protein